MIESAREFLRQKSVAVAGVSRKGDVAGNFIYRRLRAAGYEVFAVNPNAVQVEGDTCYPDLAAIPGGVDAVVIATHPGRTADIMRDCGALQIRHVWIHRSVGQGSFDEEALQIGKVLGLSVIPAGCPMMYLEPVDVVHRCMRWFLGVDRKEI